MHDEAVGRTWAGQKDWPGDPGRPVLGQSCGIHHTPNPASRRGQGESKTKADDALFYAEPPLRAPFDRGFASGSRRCTSNVCRGGAVLLDLDDEIGSSQPTRVSGHVASEVNRPWASMRPNLYCQSRWA